MLIIYSIACLTRSFAIRHTQSRLLSWCSSLPVFCLAAHPFCSPTGIAGLPTLWEWRCCWQIPNQYLSVSMSPQKVFHTGPLAVSLLSAQSWPALQHPCFMLRSCFLLLENRDLPWKLSLSHGEGPGLPVFCTAPLCIWKPTALLYTSSKKWCLSFRGLLCLHVEFPLSFVWKLPAQYFCLDSHLELNSGYSVLLIMLL